MTIGTSGTPARAAIAIGPPWKWPIEPSTVRVPSGNTRTTRPSFSRRRASRTAPRSADARRTGNAYRLRMIQAKGLNRKSVSRAIGWNGRRHADGRQDRV